MNPYSPICYLPENLTGRDFVVGDIHGQMLRLLNLLESASFNPMQGDRLFSVGDLIDRGAHSLEMLSLMRFPWFHAVPGNHELFACKLIKAMLDTDDREATVTMIKENDENMGCRWIADRWHERTTDEWNNFLGMLAALPAVLVVGHGEIRFNVTHAALLSPEGDVLTDAELDQADERLLAYISGEDFLWERDLPEKPPGVHAGTSLTYCGHNLSSHLSFVSSHLILDTGAAILGYPYSPDEDPIRPALTMIRHTGGALEDPLDIHYFQVGRHGVRIPSPEFVQQIGMFARLDDETVYRRYSQSPPSPATPMRRRHVVDQAAKPLRRIAAPALRAN